MGDAPVEMFLSGPLPEGVGDVLRRLRGTEGVRQIAVMPDVHLAAEFCVGTVVATEGLVFPNAVGGDIGCGMLALRFQGRVGAAEVLGDAERAARVLGMLAEVCPVRRHHRRTAPGVPQELREMTLGNAILRAQSSSEEVRLQLGTLGGGNHFVELQADAEDRLWLMVHTGSRHLGQLVHHHHLAFARPLSTGIMAIDGEKAAGAAYFGDVQLVRRWAWHNRAVLARGAAGVVEQVLKMTPVWESLVNIDHNHVAREVHRGREVMVHRKGATAADVDQVGLIPGSMGTRSYHTRGRGHSGALKSSSHGAGRLLSRTQARMQISRGALRQQLRGLWYDGRMEEAFREEAPGAYKPIREVMRAQAELTAQVRELRSLLVYKGR